MTVVDSSFPPAVAELWPVLFREIVWLHGRWIMYRQLYGTSPERLDLLRNCAETFFDIAHNMLLHDVQLSISKLGDPANGYRGKQNLTLHALRQAVAESGNQLLLNDLDKELEHFANASAMIRNRRNTWIAHYDRPTMLEAEIKPLTGPSRAEIEQALAALRAIMNLVELRFTNTTTAYEQFTMTDDGDSLIATLQRGLRYRQLVKERVISHDDLSKSLQVGELGYRQAIVVAPYSSGQPGA